jgi:hypothetical protein
MWKATKEYVEKNKWKVGGGIAVAGVLGYLWAYPESNPLSGFIPSSPETANAQTTPVTEDDEWGITNSPTRSTSSNLTAQQKASTQRSRILIRVRKLFSSQILQFLPLLQTKVLHAVDFDHAYSKLKEIKEQRSLAEKSGNTNNSNSNNNTNNVSVNSNSVGDSNQLWETIKDSSFTYLFVTIYASSVMCVLLRIQLHIQARMLSSIEGTTTAAIAAGFNVKAAGSSSSSSSSTTAAAASSQGQSSMTDFFDTMDTDTLKQLVNQTYTNFYDQGIKNLTNFIRSHICHELNDWPVCTNISVDYNNLTKKLSAIRRLCEGENNLKELISCMCVVPTSSSSSLSSSSSSSSSLQSEPESKLDNTNTNDTDSNTIVNNLLSQTWDVVDSTLFHAVFTEAANTFFKHLSIKLKEKVFYQENSSLNASIDVSNMGLNGNGNGNENENQSGDSDFNTSNQKQLPLASLLPKLKAITNEMLPTTRGIGAGTGGISNGNAGAALLTAEIRDIAQGPALDSLCIAIFDAPNP